MDEQDRLQALLDEAEELAQKTGQDFQISLKPNNTPFKKTQLPSNEQHRQQRQQKQQQSIFYTIHGAGGIYPYHTFEPLGSLRYLWCDNNGNKGVSKAYIEHSAQGKRWLLSLGGSGLSTQHSTVHNHVSFVGDKPIKQDKLIFAVPSDRTVIAWLDGAYKPPSTKQLFARLLKYLHLLYDLETEESYYFKALSVLMSWFARIFGSVYYDGFDARHGSGKTALLEGLMLVCRHGHVAGNLTEAYLARATSQYQLSLGVDEVDTSPHLLPLLRMGYRSGVKYGRLRERTYEPETFDVFGYKAFTFVRDLEKALASRTMVERMKSSDDKTLPILNSVKEEYGRPLFEDCFFWYMENSQLIRRRAASVASVAAVATNSDKVHTWAEMRAVEYSSILNRLGFTDVDTSVMRFLKGRNLELAFTCLRLIRIFELPIHDTIEKKFIAKQLEDADTSGDYYLTKLSDLLISKYDIGKSTLSYVDEVNGLYRSKGGLWEGVWYVSKTRLYEDFLSEIRQRDVNAIGMVRFSELLKELGWRLEETLVKQRCEHNRTKMAVKLDPVLIKRLRGELLSCEEETIKITEEVVR